jgi:hypothetical protein
VSWFKKQATVTEPAPPPESDAPPSPEAVAAPFLDEVAPEPLHEVAPPAPAVEQLTASEVEWIGSTIAELAEQDVRTGDVDDLGRYYDELLTAWLRVRDADRPGPEKVIDQIGLAFGQYLADRADLVWVIAADQKGPIVALYRAHDQVLLYPTTMVAERWDARETGILPGLAHATLRAVQAHV